MQNKLRLIAMFWFGTAMAAAFLCCGFLFLLSNFMIEHVPPPNRTYLGFLFLLYSGYRLSRQYRTYVQIRHSRHE